MAKQLIEPNTYGIYEGSMLDLFIKSVSTNPNHSKYNELKERYPLYF